MQQGQDVARATATERVERGTLGCGPHRCSALAGGHGGALPRDHDHASAEAHPAHLHVLQARPPPVVDDPLERIVDYWRRAGLEDVQVRRMSLGGGVIMVARKGAAVAAGER